MVFNSEYVDCVSDCCPVTLCEPRERCKASRGLSAEAHGLHTGGEPAGWDYWELAVWHAVEMATAQMVRSSGLQAPLPASHTLNTAPAQRWLGSVMAALL